MGEKDARRGGNKGTEERKGTNMITLKLVKGGRNLGLRLTMVIGSGYLMWF